MVSKLCGSAASTTGRRRCGARCGGWWSAATAAVVAVLEARFDVLDAPVDPRARATAAGLRRAPRLWNGGVAARRRALLAWRHGEVARGAQAAR